MLGKISRNRTSFLRTWSFILAVAWIVKCFVGYQQELRANPEQSELTLDTPFQLWLRTKPSLESSIPIADTSAKFKLASWTTSSQPCDTWPTPERLGAQWVVFHLTFTPYTLTFIWLFLWVHGYIFWGTRSKTNPNIGYKIRQHLCYLAPLMLLCLKCTSLDSTLPNNRYSESYAILWEPPSGSLNWLHSAQRIMFGPMLWMRFPVYQIFCPNSILQGWGDILPDHFGRKTWLWQLAERSNLTTNDTVKIDERVQRGWNLPSSSWYLIDLYIILLTDGCKLAVLSAILFFRRQSACRR
jgi:hypothetical protein